MSMGSGYRYFSLDLRTMIHRKSLAVRASCNQATGFIMTVYWDHEPVFNMLSDRFAQTPSPIRHKHEWGIVRWGVVR